jgi:Tol biopolymer transport system component
LFGCPFFWTGDAVIFSARKRGRAGLWEMPLSRDGQAKEPVTRLTGGGTSDDISPWLSPSGTLTVASTINDVNVWRVPLGTADTAVQADPIRITSGDGTDQDPSVSSDGRTLVFKRRIGATWKTTVHWTDSGEETVPYIPENADAVVSGDGSAVAYSARLNGAESIFVLPLGGSTPKRVCDNCGRIVDWSKNGVRLFYNDHGRLAMRDLTSSRTIDLLPKLKTIIVNEARFSPDGRWVAFTVTSAENTSHIEVADLTQGDELHPFAITDGRYRDRHPAWSTDGNTLFMYSDRDGFDCVWRVDLKPQTKGPAQEPQPVAHLHKARLTPRLLVPTAWRIAVGGRSLFLNLGEMNGNIFKGTLNAR